MAEIRDDIEKMRASAKTKPSGEQATTFVGRVVNRGAMPTGSQKFVVVNPVAITGPEIENQSGVRTVDGSTDVMVCWLGDSAPVVGQDVVVYSVANRWVTQPFAAVSVTVLGCGSRPLPGATYKTWSDSSKTTPYGSGVTNSAGTVSGAFPAGSYYEASHPRFATVSGTSTSAVVTLTTPAAGYHCSSCCAEPLPTILHYSDGLIGAVTLTYSVSGAVWIGKGIYAYGGCGNPFPGNTCPSASATVTVSLSTGCNWSWNVTTIQPDIHHGFCPNIQGSGGIGSAAIPFSATPIVVGCYPLLISFPFTAVNGAYCIAESPTTVTISE